MLNYTHKILEFDKIKSFLKKYAFCPQGIEKIEALVPLDFDSLNFALQFLDSFIQEMSSKEFPYEKLSDIKPAIGLAKKEDSFLEPSQFLEIKKYLAFIQKAQWFLIHSRFPALKSFGESLPFFAQFFERLEAVFDHEGNIKNSASDALKTIRLKLDEIKIAIESKLYGILHDPRHTEIIQEQLITIKDNRWVIPVKRDFKGRLKGLVISASGSGETVYLEPDSIVEDNNLYTEQKFEEKAEIIRILKKLTSSIRSAYPDWEILIEKTAQLDVVYCKAKYAVLTQSSFPQINTNGYFNLIKARHPLIINPVPIDVFLGRDFKILIITGPNTGGKTVCLKTIGLLTLMARCGLFIPAAENSSIGFTDEILVDIGDEQSIAQSLSTFSAHIENIKKILSKATEKSLILIDELGAGTDPQDGSSLAIAIIEELLVKKTRAVITSHMERIKNMAFHNPEIKNASVEFDLKTLSPRYKLLIGVTGKSYALEIASRLGIPQKIVDQAKIYSQAETKNQRLEDTVEKLNLEIKKMHQEKVKYENMVRNTAKKADELYMKEKELKEIENSIKKKEGGKILEQIKLVRKTLIQMIEEAKEGDLNRLKQKAKELESISQEAKNLVQFEQTTFEAPVETATFAISDLAPGDKVLILKFNKEAEVLSVQQEKQVATVMLGNIKMKLEFSEISPLTKKTANLKNNATVSMDIHTQTPIELNIIGKRRDEAMQEVEQYVGGLILKNCQEGIIIHGKGSGILKQAVLDYLKNHSAIKEYKVSVDGGATLFKFKA